MCDLSVVQHAISIILSDPDATDEERALAQRMSGGLLASRRRHPSNPRPRLSLVPTERQTK